MENNNIGELEAYAEMEARGYELFRKQYVRQTPPPKEPRLKWHSDFPFMALPFTVIALAGSLLAALRTAPVFIEIAELTVARSWAVAEGVLAMLVIDLGVIAFRYAWVYMTHHEDPDRAQITWLVKLGGVFALVAQFIAQAYAVRGIAVALNEYEVTLQILIAFAAALAGMVLAYITGEILAVLVLQRNAKHDRIRAGYSAGMSEWRDGMNRSWNATKVKMIGRPPAADEARRVRTDKGADKRASARSTGGADAASALPDTPSPAELSVMEFLRKNREKYALTTREIAEETGVNRDAVSKAKRRLSEELSGPQNSSNGAH